MTAADKQAVKILRDLYMQVDSGSDILYDARQYLQDRERYARIATLKPAPRPAAE